MLHPYMGYAGEPSEGAVLVFAHTAREARKVAYDCVVGWCDCEFIDVRCTRLRDDPEYLLTLAHPAKLESDTPHCVDDPPSCDACEMWGGRPIPERNCCTNCGPGGSDGSA